MPRGASRSAAGTVLITSRRTGPPRGAGLGQVRFLLAHRGLVRREAVRLAAVERYRSVQATCSLGLGVTAEDLKRHDRLLAASLLEGTGVRVEEL